MIEPLLTVDQVVAILGNHRITIYEYVKDGRLPAVRLGTRALRFRESDVQAFIESRSTTGADAR